MGDFPILLNLLWLTLKIFVYLDEEKRRPDIFHALKMGKHFRKSFWRFMDIGTFSQPSICNPFQGYPECFEKETGILLFPDSVVSHRVVQPLETGSYYDALYTNSRLLSQPPTPPPRQILWLCSGFSLPLKCFTAYLPTTLSL